MPVRSRQTSDVETGESSSRPQEKRPPAHRQSSTMRGIESVSSAGAANTTTIPSSTELSTSRPVGGSTRRQDRYVKSQSQEQFFPPSAYNSKVRYVWSSDSFCLFARMYEFLFGLFWLVLVPMLRIIVLQRLKSNRGCVFSDEFNISSVFISSGCTGLRILCTDIDSGWNVFGHVLDSLHYLDLMVAPDPTLAFCAIVAMYAQSIYTYN